MPFHLVPAVDASQSVRLDKAVVLFGRHPDCDVVITSSRKVSRKHCCVAQINKGFVVRDLGSMNGVRVNGSRVKRSAPLHAGDELTVGDVVFHQEQGLALQAGFELALEAVLGTVVHSAGRLVEQQYGRIPQQSAGDGHGLALTTGEIGTALADLGVVAERMAGREGVDTRETSRLEHLLVIGMTDAERDVVAKRALKQHDILQDRTDMPAKIDGVDLAKIGAVEQDRAVIRIEQTEKQLFDRGLARSDTADEGHALTDLDVEGNARPAL